LTQPLPRLSEKLGSLQFSGGAALSQLAEKLDVAVVFGWRSASALR
jgi:hypothetical protein